MVRLKKFNVTPTDEFDWDVYEDGYTGGSSLVVNKKIKCPDNKMKVYCHEKYAYDLFAKYRQYFGDKTYTAKDQVSGNSYTVSDINALNDHEVVIDSNNGMSSVIDMNKEHSFVKNLGYNNMSDFMLALNELKELKEYILKNGICAKVVDNKRVSLWEGVKSKIENEFFGQLEAKVPTYAYSAHVLEIVANGGYTVDIMGVKCFLPGSLAGAGPISDFESLLDTDIMVCIVNYSADTNNFVVSHKKYLDMVLPSKVENELNIGDCVHAKVTGLSNNGIFCIFKDKDGNFVFSALIHRSTMSKDMETDFDNGMYIKGDEFMAYIHKINWMSDTKYRIVLGDKAPIIDDRGDDEEVINEE